MDRVHFEKLETPAPGQELPLASRRLCEKTRERRSASPAKARQDGRPLAIPSRSLLPRLLRHTPLLPLPRERRMKLPLHPRNVTENKQKTTAENGSTNRDLGAKPIRDFI